MKCKLFGSIKAVLPTVAPYSKLEEVKDGTGAQVAFLEAIQSETSLDRKMKLNQDCSSTVNWIRWRWFGWWSFFRTKPDDLNF